jgi:hypothetical protein
VFWQYWFLQGAEEIACGNALSIRGKLPWPLYADIRLMQV